MREFAPRVLPVLDLGFEVVAEPGVMDSLAFRTSLSFADLCECGFQRRSGLKGDLKSARPHLLRFEEARGQSRCCIRLPLNE